MLGRASTTRCDPELVDARDLFARIGVLGYGIALLLLILLPFDITRHRLVRFGVFSLTDVTIVLFVAAGLGAITLLGLKLSLAGRSQSRRAAARDYLSRRPVLLALLTLFLLSCAVSGLRVHRLTMELPWIVEMAAGGLLWLSLSFWLQGDPDMRLAPLAKALVIGAVGAAILGFAELLLGPQFDHHLTWFKVGPTMMGQYLRLSGPFRHANIAAMYFDLSLPFAMAGLVRALGRQRQRFSAVIGWLVAVDVLLMALLLTYSRGGLFAFALSLLCMGWAMRGATPAMLGSHLRRNLLIVGLNLGAIFGLFAAPSWPLDVLRLSTASDASWYRADYRSSLPRTMAVGATYRIPVTVENRGPMPWQPTTPRTLALSYHWLYPSWRVAQYNTTLTWLSSAVPPGAKQTIVAWVRTPPTPGRYLLTWDMLWRDSFWFGSLTATYHATAIRIVGPPGSRRHNVPAVAAARPPQRPPPVLPISYSPTREHIWAVAISLLGRSPLLGLGAQGFFRNYHAVSGGAPLSNTSQAPAHAHNLFLEVAVDFGLIGELFFVALLLALWWPAFSLLRTGQTSTVWGIAVVGAIASFLGHSLVDYFLGTEPILVMFWILGGLAWTLDCKQTWNASCRYHPK